MRRTYNVVGYKNGMRNHFTVIRNTLEEVFDFVDELIWIDNYSSIDIYDTYGNLINAY